MDLKRPGNLLYLVGETKNELGGSHFALVNGLSGGQVPTVDADVARETFAAMHRAIRAGLVRACHDLSEGGLAVAVAEMAFAGGEVAAGDELLIEWKGKPPVDSRDDRRFEGSMASAVALVIVKSLHSPFAINQCDIVASLTMQCLTPPA